jgi:hypothetical protein
MKAVCPYCRCPLEEGDTRTTCPGCGTPHHADCFAENGGCTVFGCSHAPSDEPALRVSAGELEPRGVTASEPKIIAAQSAPPPPPLMSANTPPPPPSRLEFRPTSGAPPLTLAEVYADAQAHRNRTTFVLLGIFLGAFGVHNFYAGYHRKGAAQLCLTLFTCFYAAIVSEIWAIVEVCIVTRDGDDLDFR